MSEHAGAADPLRARVLAMAQAGNEAATIAAAVGIPLQELLRRFGTEMEHERAKALVVLRQKLMKEALGQGPGAAAARRTVFRQLQVASAPLQLPLTTPVSPEAEGDDDDLSEPSVPLVNLEQMAEALRVSMPTMRKLMRRYPDLPVVGRGTNGQAYQFDAAAVIAFVKAKKAAEAEANAARDELLAQVSLPLEDVVPPEDRGLTASDRLKNAQAMLKEDEVARQRGFLVLMTDVRMVLTPVWAEMSSFLQALPNSVGRPHNLPDAVIRDLRARISAKQRELHGRIAHMLDASPAEEEKELQDGPSAAA